MKAIQYFSKEYLERCNSMTPEQIIQFLEDFRALHYDAKPRKSRLISIKIPDNLLNAFKAKAKIHGVNYQTQIKKLMKDWVT
ncbi:MAG: BrnA antitoxin family protein [Candidatus Dadabacteria bacterium]|nr:BrnA antitoxin family protein [Candidatus Dadabacteria bacterium]